MNKLKSSVVKITIPNTNYSGSGFFVNEKGYIITCWHVIAPAISFNKQLNKWEFSRLIIHTASGDTAIYAISDYFLTTDFPMDKLLDYCLIVPIGKLSLNHSYLQLGYFSEINEGDEVYAAGFPLGLNKLFVSRGMLSTKLIDSLSFRDSLNNPVPIICHSALLDLTLNKGNSGGPVIMLGKSVNEDRVIGISDFIINPFSRSADSIDALANNPNVQFHMGGLDLQKSLRTLSEAISNSSMGISGCISSDRLAQILSSN